MTQSFDEWKEEQERIHNDYDAENAWYAGAQSKQAEIDKLQHKVKCEREISLFADKLCVDLQSQVDELRKRIDEIEGFCIKGVGSNMLSIDYNQALIDMHKILKGTTNEN
jgi:predicted nuclease with TOPRIM domain